MPFSKQSHITLHQNIWNQAELKEKQSIALAVSKTFQSQGKSTEVSVRLI